MERLTSRCKAIGDSKIYYPVSNFLTGEAFQQIVNKLGQYEDAEENREEYDNATIHNLVIENRRLKDILGSIKIYCEQVDKY